MIAQLPPDSAEVISYPFSLGGGSTPDAAFSSWAIVLHGIRKPEEAKKALRFCRIPIIAIISDNRLIVHLASVDPADDSYIVQQLKMLKEVY